MKYKIRGLSILLSAMLLVTSINSVKVSAVTDETPAPVGSERVVNGVTEQDYQFQVTYLDNDSTTNYYEIGSMDKEKVLSRVPNTLTKSINGKDVILTASGVSFAEDTDKGFPLPIKHNLDINCGVMDYALYQYKTGGYSINASEVQGNFSNIPLDAVDTTIVPGGSCNSNKMLVWNGNKSNGGNPIFACEPYQSFYPQLNSTSSSPTLRREPYDVTGDLKLTSTAMLQPLTIYNQPIVLYLPQGQHINPNTSYDFYAICSRSLGFTYTATNGTNTYKHTSYTTLSNPMTLSDLQYYYPDYSDSTYFLKQNLCSLQGNDFTDNGTVTRNNINGNKQAVHKYTAYFNFGYIQPAATYTYTSLDHLYVPTVTYKGTYTSSPVTPPVNPPSDLKAPVAHISAPTEVHTGTPVYVTGYGTDPQGLKITDYEWTSSTGETITGTGGTINLTGDSATVTLKVENEKGLWSDTVTAIVGAVNHPPTVYLQTPSSVVMGDDVAVNAYGSDIDGDPLYYIWNNPSDFLGSCSGTSGMGYFNTLGYKYFTVTAYDPFGASASASSSVNVIAPIPNVVITKAGTEKENRKITLDAEKFSTGGSQKFPVDWLKSTWEFFDANGNKLSIDNNSSSNTIIKSLDGTTGTKSMSIIVKQQGIYKVRCTLTNTAGYTNYADINLYISPDIVPVPDFNLPKTDVRDIKDPSPHGLAQATKILSDSSSSTDGDVIAKRMWIATFDSDNDGSYIWITKNEDGTTKSTPTYERWYIYDLNYNGDTDTQKGDTTDPNQPNVNDSLNPHWRYVGNYYDVKDLNIDTVNCGNLTSVQFKSTSVGQFDFEEVVKEDFGQETIPQLIIDKDKKQASSWEIIN